jgi:hypothetical protein
MFAPFVPPAQHRRRLRHGALGALVAHHQHQRAPHEAQPLRRDPQHAHVPRDDRGRFLAPYSDQKVANREIRVWHFVIENGY